MKLFPPHPNLSPVPLHSHHQRLWMATRGVGSLCLSRTSLRFEPDQAKLKAGAAEEGDGNAEARLWRVRDIRQMQRRRYLLSHTALELFASQVPSDLSFSYSVCVLPAPPPPPPTLSAWQSTVFFHLFHKRKREKLRRALRVARTPTHACPSRPYQPIHLTPALFFTACGCA